MTQDMTEMIITLRYKLLQFTYLLTFQKQTAVKKLMFLIVAFSMMFVTSCLSESELGTANVGNLTTVSFKINSPVIATRAYSDGLSATLLQYAVYDAAGNELTDLTVTDGIINGSTPVELQLVK